MTSEYQRDLEDALKRAMVLLAEADDKLSESLLDSLFDSDTSSFSTCEFYNDHATGGEEG